MLTQNIQDQIDALPEAIKNWLSSQRVMFTIVDLNDRLNIGRDRYRVIANLILRLAIQDLEPRDFINQLSIDLNVSMGAAKTITKEIEEKILHPIEEPLRNSLGVDIALLHFPKEETLLPLAEVAKILKERKQATEDVRPRTGVEQLVPEDEGPRKEEGGRVPTGPMMLHTEKEEVKPVGENLSAAGTQRPTFSIKIPITQKKYAPKTPVTAKIELPQMSENKRGGFDKPTTGENVTPPPLSRPSIFDQKPAPFAPQDKKIAPPLIAKPEIKRVVHYSQFITPIE